MLLAVDDGKLHEFRCRALNDINIDGNKRQSQSFDVR
jgi:hypothetical protein